MGYYSATKTENEIMLPASPWTDPEIIILIKSDGERQVSYDRELICGILKKL